MNSKIQKLNSEIKKAEDKINTEKARITEMRKQIADIENVEMLSVIRKSGLDLTELQKLLNPKNNNHELEG